MISQASENRKLFDTVYEHLFPVIFRVAYRITGDRGLTEDLCHEAFIKYFQRGEPFPNIEQTKYWLIRVVKNLSLNSEKKRKREKRAYDKLQRLSIGYTDSEEAVVVKEELKVSVQKALSRLPYNLRVVLVFKEYAGLSYREIGSILGISEGNVKIRVFRARERLTKIFKEGWLHVP